MNFQLGVCARVTTFENRFSRGRFQGWGRGWGWFGTLPLPRIFFFFFPLSLIERFFRIDEGIALMGDFDFNKRRKEVLSIGSNIYT